MVFEQLLERLKGIEETRDLARAFDPDRADHVDRVVRALLQQFHRSEDWSEFHLLISASERQLVCVARDVTREVGAAVAPEKLACALYSRILLDTQRQWPDIHDFLRRARASLVEMTERWVQLTARGEVDCDVNSPSFELHVSERSESSTDEHERWVREYLRTASRAFHTLSRADRRLLLAAAVDEAGPDELARIAGVSAMELGEALRAAEDRCDRARRRLFDAPEEGGPR